MRRPRTAPARHRHRASACAGPHRRHRSCLRTDRRCQRLVARVGAAVATKAGVLPSSRQTNTPSAVSVELKATRKPHGAEVAVRMPLALWATLAPPPR